MKSRFIGTIQLFSALAFYGAWAGTPGAAAAAAGAGQSNAPVVVSSGLIERLAAEAETNHPAVRAAYARAEAARWNAVGVRQWEDPMARFGYMGADREKRGDDGDLIFGFDQKLPLFGKPQQARRVAEAEAATEQHQAMFRAHQLRREITAQVVKLALAERLVELSALDVAWLDTIVATTEEKYRNATGTQFDTLQAQNERARRGNMLRTAQTNVWYERVALNRIMARPLDSAWPSFQLPGVADELPPASELVHHALELAPQLQVMGSGVHQAEASVEQAKRQRLPDVAAGAELRQYSGSGEAREGTLMLSLSLPWGNRSRYRADVRREESKLEAARLDLADMQLGISDEISKLSAQIDSARREALIYRDDILPRSEQALAMAHATWTANRGMFRDVLDARRMLVEAQMSYARALAEQYSMIAELILHCGLHEFGTLESVKLPSK